MIDSAVIFQLSMIIPHQFWLSLWTRCIGVAKHMMITHSSLNVRDINLLNFFLFFFIATLIIHNQKTLRTHCSASLASVSALDKPLSSCLVSCTFLSSPDTWAFRVCVRSLWLLMAEQSWWALVVKYGEALSLSQGAPLCNGIPLWHLFWLTLSTLPNEIRNRLSLSSVTFNFLLPYAWPTPTSPQICALPVSPSSYTLSFAPCFRLSWGNLLSETRRSFWSRRKPKSCWQAPRLTCSASNNFPAKPAWNKWCQSWEIVWHGESTPAKVLASRNARRRISVPESFDMWADNFQNVNNLIALEMCRDQIR